MVLYLVRLALGKILTSPQVKQTIFEQLRLAAAKSETTIDDDGVKVVEEIWEIAVPIIAGRVVK
jgi:hypothetical protein